MMDEKKTGKRLNRRNLLIGGGLAVAAGSAGIYKFTGPGGRVVEGKSRARPIRTLSIPPAEADVVVIGGGIIGAAIAFELARRNLSVVVCEKGAIAGEASGRSVGVISAAGLDPIKIPLVNRAKELWDGYNSLVGGETGWRANGSSIFFDQAEVEEYFSQWLDGLGNASQGRIMSAREVRERFNLSHDWSGAYFDATDGCAEPVLAAPAIAEGAQRLGASIVAPCAVRTVETEGGRVTGVVTEKGRIRTSRIILAGGCWSSLFAGNFGLRLPYFNMFSMCREVGNVNGPDGSGHFPGVSWRKQINGKYTISVVGGTVPLTPGLLRFGGQFIDAMMHAEWDIHPNISSYFFEQLRVPSSWQSDDVTPFEKLRILQPTENGPIARKAVDDIRKQVPAFRDMELGELWSGALVATPDNMPTISEVEGISGLVLATGFSYGLTMAPAVGEAVAQLVAGEKTGLDLKPYRYSRYTDGTKLNFTA